MFEAKDVFHMRHILDELRNFWHYKNNVKMSERFL